MLLKKIIDLIKPFIYFILNIPIINKLAINLFKLLPSPYPIYIAITSKCQMNCIHCGMSELNANHHDELSNQVIYGLIDEIAKTTRVGKICFFGGEPLLRKEIFDFIRHANSYKIETEIDTNGYLINNDVSRKLKDAGINVIRISLDGYDSDTHDSIRGKKEAFNRACDAIRIIKNQGILCETSVVVTSENINNSTLQKIIDLSFQLGADRVRLLPRTFTGKSKTCSPLNKDEEKILFSLLKNGKIYYESMLCSGKKSNFICYTMLKKFFYIGNNGDVQPCMYMPIVFGNIHNQPVSKIISNMWKSDIFNRSKFKCPMTDNDFIKKYIV